MENSMFCYQCQETSRGIGCVLKGVCGKNSSTSSAMDLLLFVVRGVSVVANSLRVKGQIVDSKVDGYIVDALFSTITNANFDDESILKRVDNGLQIRQALISQAERAGIDLPSVDEVVWDGQRSEYEGKAKSVGVLREPNEDIRSLKELTVYGLKGMAAYLEHAMCLGYNDESVHAFIQSALADMTVKSMTADELIALVMRTGEVGVQTMALLDKANTESYGNPEITKVNIGVGKNPGILISGHVFCISILLSSAK